MTTFSTIMRTGICDVLFALATCQLPKDVADLEHVHMQATVLALEVLPLAAPEIRQVIAGKTNDYKHNLST